MAFRLFASLSILFLSGCASFSQYPTKDPHSITIGMSGATARYFGGDPDSVNTTMTENSEESQWVYQYAQPNPVYVYVDPAPGFPTGEVTAIQY